MNIIVIGSCTDSSSLAKELNKRLQNSIIARIDLLKNIKQAVMQEIGDPLTTTENLGTYIGDVETHDFPRYDKETLSNISKVIKNTIDSTKTIKMATRVKGRAVTLDGSPRDLPASIISAFDAITNMFPSGTYSFVKVYSGAVNDKQIERLQRNGILSGSIVIKLNNPIAPVIPIEISDQTLTQLKATAFHYLECNSISDVFKSEVYQLLLNIPTEEKKESAEVDPKETILLEAA